MRLTIALAVALAACSGPKSGEPAVTQTADSAAEATPLPAHPEPSDVPRNAPEVTNYVGRWAGVEGMYLVISERPENGLVLDMQYDLDHKGTYRGEVLDRHYSGGPGIVFEREGRTETLRPTDGEATGLKYLAGKKDCLTVKPGEGYCRD